MNPENFQAQCLQAGYIADDELCLTLTLMQTLARPLLVEGEAGVGKTAIAKTLAEVLERPLVRLQCYEGLDANAAVYEWNYSHQLLSIKLRENETSSTAQGAIDIFSDEFLLERPLLKAIRSKRPSVLLIDEIDRADEAFEAFLLELLSDFQISIPELGTIKASTIPVVVLTSNGTRALSDALRRRCLYHYLDYPSRDKELAIIAAHMPDIDVRLSAQVVEFVHRLRDLDLKKSPGIAETLDWVSALVGLQVSDLLHAPELVKNSRACLLKTREDVEFVDAERVTELLTAIR